MTLTGTIRQERIKAIGTELYCEVRGSGPSVLFISGASGDAGHFSAVADTLADEFTTITYDRRGNSRSPKPAGWTTTTMGEHADDAAALIGRSARHPRRSSAPAAAGSSRSTSWCGTQGSYGARSFTSQPSSASCPTRTR